MFAKFQKWKSYENYSEGLKSSRHRERESEKKKENWIENQCINFAGRFLYYTLYSNGLFAFFVYIDIQGNLFPSSLYSSSFEAGECYKFFDTKHHWPIFKLVTSDVRWVLNWRLWMTDAVYLFVREFGIYPFYHIALRRGCSLMATFDPSYFLIQ